MKNSTLALMAATFLLSACGWMGSKEDAPLMGERAPILPSSASEFLELEDGVDLTTITLPSETTNTVWSQNLGYPSHNPTHLTFSNGVEKKMWDANLGQGITTKAPIIATPVIAQNTVFAADTKGTVTAYNLDTGKRLWRTTTLADNQNKKDIIAGGGLAYGRDTIFANNGSRDIVAINAKDGSVLWRTKAKSALRGAPTTLAGRVYTVDAANNVMALDASTGKEIWSYQGAQQEIAILGIPSPALTSDTVITALSDGSIIALDITDGTVLWRGKFSGARGTRVSDLNNLRDVIAPPVIDGASVLTSNASGLVMSTNAFTGTRNWQKDIGANGSVWTAGNVFYVLTQTGFSARSKSDGAPIWSIVLPQFEDESIKEDPITWFGPYLLSGQVFVFNSMGKALTFNAIDGIQTGAFNIPDHLATRPIVANNKIVFVTKSGQLSVWK